MRYQSLVTDFVNASELTQLAAAERRLAGTLAHPRRVALACIAALTGLGWLALGLLGTDQFSALCRPLGAGAWSEVALLVPMWAAMTLAMMLPTAGPMILTYAEIADTAARKREPVVSPMVLTAGYVAVWLGFALIAAALQSAASRAGLLVDGKAMLPLAGLIVLLAGLYQFSALKHACLSVCQRPFPFFFANWTEEPRGVFRLGLRQGLLCLGCCWAMMLVMFAVGAMNVIWMAALAVVMTIEKLAVTARFSRIVGAALLAAGAGMLVMSVL